jgi:hypothetical protein
MFQDELLPDRFILFCPAFGSFLRVCPKSSENVFLPPVKEVCFPLIFPEEQDGFE